MLNNISIILVEPQGDENIGMIARAMANCGLDDLRLVKPAEYKTAGSKKWAVHAFSIIEKAKKFNSLQAACADVSSVIALSRRKGRTRPPVYEFSQAMIKTAKQAAKAQIALVFGPEADGLSSADLVKCDTIISIPTDEAYPSINLAQSVLLVCHHLYLQQSLPKKQNIEIADSYTFLTKQEAEPVLMCIKETLVNLGYNDDNQLVSKITKHFAEIFGRAGLRCKDANMFLGLMARIKQKIGDRS